jgi:hypothetical protein
MRFLVCLILLGVVPMLLLNGQGRPAFVGYYLGVLTLWLVFVIAASRAADPRLTLAAIARCSLAGDRT